MTNATHTPLQYWQPILGGDIVAFLNSQKEHEVPRGDFRPGCFQSDHLCAFHSKISAQGYEGAQFVKSIYGWGLRYESGLNNHAIIYSARGNRGIVEDALIAAQEWVKNNPKKRYVMGCPEARAAIAKATGKP